LPSALALAREAEASIERSINNIVQENPKPKDPSAKDPKQEYENAAGAAVEDIDSDNEYAPSDDSLNFLGNAPGCSSLNDGWLEEL